MMENVPRLRLVPPPQRLNGYADFTQGSHGLFDLDLRPSVRETEGKLTIKKDLHDSKIVGCLLKDKLTKQLENDQLKAKAGVGALILETADLRLLAPTEKDCQIQRNSF